MTLPSRRALLAGASAALCASPAGALPLRLPFGGKPKPKPAGAVDLAAIVRDTGAPALGAAVVAAKGMLFLDAAGRRRLSGEELVGRDDVWALAANTQGLTSALFGLYAQKGRTSFGVRLPALFPDLTVDPAWAETRLSDVLSHRAGITDVGVVDADWLARAAADPASPRDQRTAATKALLAAPPARTPGAFEYAGLNYVLAGAALERIAGKPFEAAMRADLFNPLGMGAGSGFAPPAQTGAPWGHSVVSDGRQQPIDPQGGGYTPAVFAPSAGASMSLSDYAGFLRLFLTDGGGVLTPETLNRLGRPWGGADGEWGMGWQVWRERAWAQGPVLEHEGSDGLFHILAQVAPERGLAVVAVANADAGGGAEAVRRASQALIRAYAA